MKTILKIVVLVVLVLCWTDQSLAQSDHPVSIEMAKDLGVKFSWKTYNTNVVEVSLQFSPTGKLARFNACELLVASDRRQVLRASLMPLERTDDKVVLSFLTSPDFLAMCTLSLAINDHAQNLHFAIKDFVKMSPRFTFIGVPRALSTNTFPGSTELKKALSVDVVRVTAGSLEGKQVTFPFHSKAPWTPKLGVQYSITAGYEQNGDLKLMECHETKNALQ